MKRWYDLDIPSREGIAWLKRNEFYMSFAR